MAVLDTVTVPVIITGNVSGPASYTTGGFLVDLSASLNFVRFLSLEIETIDGLASDEYEVILNQDTAGAFSPGKAVVRLLIDKYNKLTVGNVSSNPGGTTVQAAAAQTGTTTGSAHTHPLNHDHPITTSGTPTAGGSGVATGGAAGMTTHTHTVDVANFVGNTSSTTHTHQRSFEYDHTHPTTQAENNVTLTEVTATTNLSTVTWRFFAIGD